MNIKTLSKFIVFFVGALNLMAQSEQVPSELEEVKTHLTVENGVEEAISKKHYTGISGNGAITVNGSLSVSDSKFSDNASDSSGGAIVTRAASGNNNSSLTLDISNTVFNGNTGVSSGGAVYNTFYSNKDGTAEGVRISNSTFTLNTATGGSSVGGAVYNRGDADSTGALSKMTISNSNFSENSADYYGAVHNRKGEMTILNGSFVGNFSKIGGGAVGNSGTMFIQGTTFKNNSSLSKKADGGYEGDGGVIYNLKTLTVESAIFEGNTANIGGVFQTYGATALSTIIDSTFTGNSARTDGGVFYGNGSSKTVISGSSTFTGNKANVTTDSDGNYVSLSSDLNAIGGGVIALGANTTFDITSAVFDGNISGNYGGAIGTRHGVSYDADGNLDVNDLRNTFLYVDGSTFKNNVALKDGGAIYSSLYADSKEAGKGTIISNSNFSNNEAYGNGGAIYNDGEAYKRFNPEEVNCSVGKMTVVDSVFTGNKSGANGGAIYNDGILTIKATKDISSVNNQAKDEASGGFLFADAGSDTSVDVAQNATLTIGNKDVSGFDSIASADSTAVINKTGLGKWNVNSSMQNFTGTLNVKAGEMNVDNRLGASVISIDSGATLGLTIKGDNTLSNTSLTLSNNGTINLVAGAGLSLGEYKVSATKNSLDWNKVVSYGGKFVDGVFGVYAPAGELVVGAQEQQGILVEDFSRVSVVSGGESKTVLVEMAFSDLQGADVKVNNVLDVTETMMSNVAGLGDFAKAYDFDVTGLADSGDSVVLSFFVGKDTLTAADFMVYHEDANGNWALAKDISGASYDGEYFSFVVSHFSSYGITVVPEPSTYALIFGVLALGFVVYRRRK